MSQLIAVRVKTGTAASPDPPVSMADSRLMNALLLLTTLSGAVGLMHETLWTRRLVDVLGSTAEATSRVFGTFLLGLAIGAALAGWLAPRLRRPLLMCGVMEALIGLTSFPLLFLPEFSDRLLDLVPGFTGSANGAVKLVISLVAIGPASMAMGTVLPLLVAGVRTRARSGDSAGFNGSIYAWNLIGGVLGLLAISLYVLPFAGLGRSMQLCSGLNLVLGIGFMAIDRAWTASSGDSASASPRINQSSVAQRTMATWMPVVAFFSGMTVLAFEMAALRALMLVAPICSFAPPVLLAIVLASLAAGALLACALDRQSARRSIAWLLSLSGLAFVVSPWTFMLVARFADLSPSPTFNQYLAKLVLLGLAAFGAPFVIAGAVFPLTLLRAERHSAETGTWGWLLFVNGIGSWIGSEAANHWLMPAFGPLGSMAAIAILPLSLASAAALGGALKSPGVLITVVAGAGAAAFTAGPLSRRQLINPHLGWKVAEQRSDCDLTAAVVEHSSFGKAILVSNQYLLGSSQAANDQRRQAHLPLLLHSDPHTVAFIGVATGITPGAALLHPEVQRIDAIELSPLIADLADRHFAAENYGLFNDARVNVVIDDARYVLKNRPGVYDVVIGDLILPWSPGEARLYTLEHFSAARRSLKPGGVYVQWLPAYQLTEHQFAIVERTFRAVFPNVELIRRDFRIATPALGLVGWSDDRRIDWPVVEQRCQALKLAGRVLDPSVRNAAGVRMLSLGSLPQPEVRALNSLNDPVVEVDAGVQRVTGRPSAKYLLGGRWLNFLARTAAADGPHPDSPNEGLQKLALQWSRHEGQLLMSQEAGRRLTIAPPPLPEELSADVGADWSEWPSAVRVRQFPDFPMPSSSSN